MTFNAFYKAARFLPPRPWRCPPKWRWFRPRSPLTPTPTSCAGRSLWTAGSPCPATRSTCDNAAAPATGGCTGRCSIAPTSPSTSSWIWRRTRSTRWTSGPSARRAPDRTASSTSARRSRIRWGSRTEFEAPRADSSSTRCCSRCWGVSCSSDLMLCFARFQAELSRCLVVSYFSWLRILFIFFCYTTNIASFFAFTADLFCTCESF